MNEMWKIIIIDGYETVYEVSTMGRVRNSLTGHILSPGTNRGGYRYVNIFVNGVRCNCRVHRLVANAFIPNPENKPIVNHIRGKANGDAVDNLEWSTSSENNYHAYATNLKQKLVGEQVYTSKLTENIVNEICRLLEDGSLCVREIAEKLNITRSLVEGILYRGHWSHITCKYNIDPSNVKKDYGNQKHPRKLTEDVVIKILQLRDDKYTYPEIKRILNIDVSKETLRNICKGKIWNDVYMKYKNHTINKSSTTIERDEDKYLYIDIALS